MPPPPKKKAPNNKGSSSSLPCSLESYPNKQGNKPRGKTFRRKLAKLSKDSSATLREKGTGGDQNCILEVTLWEAQLCPGSLTPPHLAGKGGFRWRSGKCRCRAETTSPTGKSKARDGQGHHHTGPGTSEPWSHTCA